MSGDGEEEVVVEEEEEDEEAAPQLKASTQSAVKRYSASTRLRRAIP